MASNTNSPNPSQSGRSTEIRRFRRPSLKNHSFKIQKKDCSNEEIERLVNYSVNSICVSKVLNRHFNCSTDEERDLENPISPEDEYIGLLLEKRKDITERVRKIAKENRELEEALFKKKLQLKESTAERNEAWNKAVEVLKSVTPKPNISLNMFYTSSNSEDFSNDSDSNHSIFEDDITRSTYRMKMKKGVQEKYKQIQEISCVLHKMISFSGNSWATDKNLLDIVLCTGKILNTNFNVNNPRHFEKFVLECIQKLNGAKWELYKHSSVIQK